MKKFLVAFAAVAAASAVHAAPFVVGDTVSEADTCIWVTDTSPEVSSPVIKTTTPPTCKVDVGGVSVGTHTVKVKVRNAVWGSATDSPFSSLTFVRPAALEAPVSIRLSQ